jgi:uncharacterized protein YlxW (UPF0749 family)
VTLRAKLIVSPLVSFAVGFTVAVSVNLFTSSTQAWWKSGWAWVWLVVSLTLLGVQVFVFQYQTDDESLLARHRRKSVLDEEAEIQKREDRLKELAKVSEQMVAAADAGDYDKFEKWANLRTKLDKQ